jgi:Uma2 family endonuclease
MTLATPVGEQERTYSAADLWAMSHDLAYADLRLELSEGKLITTSPASYQHGKLASKLDRAIGIFVEEHDLGDVTGAETGYILYKNPDPEGKDTVRAPDVGFVSKARSEKLTERELRQGYFPGAPDLAVEVVSPGDSADEIQTKIDEYLQYGTRMVIVAYERRQVIVVHTPDGAKTYRTGDSLEGGDVLPGFVLHVSEIFK